MAPTYRTPHGTLIERDQEPVATLTVREAAARYGVSISTIYRRCRNGRIIATKNTRGHWEILNNGVTLQVAEMAATMRNRFQARTLVSLAPTQGPDPIDDDYAMEMYDRRRKLIAA